MESRQKCVDTSESLSRCRKEKRKLTTDQGLLWESGDCHCKMVKTPLKDGGKSRVWRKVMWFSRKNKNNHKHLCHHHSCHTGQWNNEQPVTHSNSWSFTRSATKRFRLSSRKHRYKSNASSCSHRHVNSKANTRQSPASTESPTATGSFCDFGNNGTGSLGRTRQYTQISLFEIARELNPPSNLPLEDSEMNNVYGKSVHRSETFPRYYPSKIHSFDKYTESHNERCLRRRATFSNGVKPGLMRTKTLKKYSSTNSTSVVGKENKLTDSTSHGEIHDQDGSIIGIVHFFKSPRNSYNKQNSSSSLGKTSPESSSTNTPRLDQFERHINSYYHHSTPKTESVQKNRNLLTNLDTDSKTTCDSKPTNILDKSNHPLHHHDNILLRSGTYVSGQNNARTIHQSDSTENVLKAEIPEYTKETGSVCQRTEQFSGVKTHEKDTQKTSAFQMPAFCSHAVIEMNYVWYKVTFDSISLENVMCIENNTCIVNLGEVASIKKRRAKIVDISNTSDYASCSDEDILTQNDPVNLWKKSSQLNELEDTEIRLPVPGKAFKMRTELLLSWFEEFNDEQKNIVVKKLLDRCDLPQMHLLSVAMEANLHKTCPPNCQDMLVWLPYTVTINILLYLDVVSLCRCNQVNRAWNDLSNNPVLWQQLARSPDYQLSEAGNKKLYKKYSGANNEIHWKKVVAERFLLQRNWLEGKYTLKTFNGHNQGIACVQFDDTRIVSGSSDKTIKLWDISNETSQLMLTLAGHSGTVRCLHLNGNRLVSGSTDRTIKVWDLSFASYWAGASCKVTMVGHLHTVRCLQADDKKLVSGSYDKTVKVWDLKTGQCQLTLRGHTAAVLCVQFDDQKIVSGSYDKKIKVWSLNDGTCLMTLDGHHDAVTCLNLTHDGMKIITGSLDYTLKFWDLLSGKCYGTLDWITSEGHTAVVRCLQVDSWRIISGGDDKTLKVWELTTGQRLLTLRYHSDGVTCMQFNDFAIVSGSYDRTVKLWDFTPHHPYLESVS